MPNVLPLLSHQLHKTRIFLGGVAKKVAVQHKFVNFMYFTYEEAEIQILHKYPVV